MSGSCGAQPGWPDRPADVPEPLEATRSGFSTASTGWSPTLPRTRRCCSWSTTRTGPTSPRCASSRTSLGAWRSLPVALLIAARPRGRGCTRGDRRDPATTRIEPPALGLEGVGRLLREHGPVDDAFAHACHDATGGNPFLLGELVRALRADGVPFTAAGAERVTEATPPTVSRAVAATLAPLGAEATALAPASAVLAGRHALDAAAELAGLPVQRGAAAAAELRASGLSTTRLPMRFRHPILTAAVRAGLSTYDRAAAHSRAADLLRARGAAPERVALQLLHAPPAGNASVVSELRLAAESARERGAPATAAALLLRALAEPPEPALLGEVLFELGRAELATASPDAPDHLAEAHRAAADPAIRGRALVLLAQAIPVRRECSTRLLELVADALPDVQKRDQGGRAASPCRAGTGGRHGLDGRARGRHARRGGVPRSPGLQPDAPRGERRRDRRPRHLRSPQGRRAARRRRRLTRVHRDDPGTALDRPPRRGGAPVGSRDRGRAPPRLDDRLRERDDPARRRPPSRRAPAGSRGRRAGRARRRPRPRVVVRPRRRPAGGRAPRPGPGSGRPPASSARSWPARRSTTRLR